MAQEETAVPLINGGTWGNISPKSLIFCLVFENPWAGAEMPRNIRRRPLDDDDDADQNPVLLDNDLLAPKEESTSPSPCQKLIDIIRRMQIRGLDVFPEGMLVTSEGAHDDPYTLGGHKLDKNAMYFSPDKDQIYIGFHCETGILKRFAEDQNIVLMTHPYSDRAGAGTPYSKAEERRLIESVKNFPGDLPEKYKTGKQWGFQFKVPQKARLIIRLLRTEWVYGGCGIQVLEMKRKGVLQQIFPVHNPAYLHEYGMRDWGSLMALISTNPVRQNDSAVIQYLGEKVALYFVWIKQFIVFQAFMLLPAIVIETGVIHKITDKYHTSFGYGIFSIFAILWGALWNTHWLKKEDEYEVFRGQDIELQQEMVRDEYRFDPPPRAISTMDIYSMNFEFPLTIKYAASGEMFELPYSNTTRQLYRFGITYPVSLAMLGGLVYAFLRLTQWKLENPENDKVAYGSSGIITLSSVIFSFVFDKVLRKLIDLQNPRTYTEYTNEYIRLSFILYFFNYYSPLFIIGLWPNDKVTGMQRIEQLRTQLFVNLVIKPGVQNLQELFLPPIKTALRRHADKAGSFFGGVTSLLTCEKVEYSPTKEHTLWKESQLEPYDTSADFLEITVNYGFMIMFASVFPGGFIAGFFYNLVELRIDAWKLLNTFQRPIPEIGASIGAWNSIFIGLTIIGAISNAYLMFIIAPTTRSIKESWDTDAGRLKSYLVSQYGLLMLAGAVVFVTGTRSVAVAKYRAKQSLLAIKAANSGAHLETRAIQQQMAAEKAGGQEAEKVNVAALKMLVASKKKQLLAERQKVAALEAELRSRRPPTRDQVYAGMNESEMSGNDSANESQTRIVY